MIIPDCIKNWSIYKPGEYPLKSELEESKSFINNNDLVFLSTCKLKRMYCTINIANGILCIKPGQSVIASYIAPKEVVAFT